MNVITNDSIISFDANGITKAFQARGAQGTSGPQLAAAIRQALATLPAGLGLTERELAGGADGSTLYYATGWNNDPPVVELDSPNVKVSAFVEGSSAALTAAVAHEFDRLAQLITDDPGIDVILTVLDTAVTNAGGSFAAVLLYWEIASP